MESIKNRTSIRKYAEKEVSEELLNRLLEEAERTPTMGNLQLYSVVVTRSEEGKKALAPAHFNQPMVTEAPVVLTICADYRRTTLWAENRKGTPGYDNILSFMNAATDALLLEALEENKEFVRINNVETLAQVFTDIRYTKKDCEAMSQGFLEALKQQGFI